MMPNLDPEEVAERRAVRQLMLYILGEVLISIFLIAFNAGLVFGMVQALGRLFPRFDFSDQLSPSALPQLIIYIVPILLLFLEWYAWDVITSLRKNRNKV